MAITKMTPATSGDHEAVTTPGGVVVVSGDATYENLATAVSALVAAIRADEHNKLTAARIVDTIDRQELYREAGVDTFRAFLPALLEQTAAVGWKSATSIKRYLAWYRLYIRELGFEPREAVNAVSHLHQLYVLANIDRKSGELAFSDKDGKLDPARFEDVVRLVLWAVAGTTREQQVAGLHHDDVEKVLATAPHATHMLQTFRELMGRRFALPARGWTLADTQGIIDRVRAPAEVEEEKAARCQRVWVGHVPFSGAVYVSRLEFRHGEVVLDTLPVEREYAEEHFTVLRGKDAVEIANKEYA